jgi:glycosyltransferase involved in cell wall biosynthesis
MKILHVVEAFGGGIIEFINQISNGLQEHKHFILYAHREIPIEDIKIRFNNNCEFIEWRHASRDISIKKDLLAYKSLSEVVYSIKPDVIHLHSSKAGFIGRLWGLFNHAYRSKIIYTPNGLYFIRRDLSRVKRLSFGILEYIAGKCSGQIIGVSLSESKALEDIGLRATFINNGVIPWKDGTTSLRKFDKFTIVTVGRISEQKNPASFRHIAETFKDDPNIEFIWVGEGQLSEMISSVKNIKITGWLDTEKVKEILCRSHLYLSTALWEGLPFAVLEAMNASLALVLSNCVGNVDLIRDNPQNGIIFENEQVAVTQIRKMVKQPQIVLQLGKASLEFLKERFNSKNMVDCYNIEYNYIFTKNVKS